MNNSLRPLLNLLIISCIAQLSSQYIPFTIPAALYGIVFVLIALQAKWLSYDKFAPTGDFILSNFALCYLPSMVNIINLWSDIAPIWMQFILIGVVSTIITFGVTAATVTLVCKLMKKTSA